MTNTPYIRTPEHNRRISEALKGHPMYKSKERSRKLSEAHKGKPSGRKGIPHTSETKQKLRDYYYNLSDSEKNERIRVMSEANVGKKQSEELIAKRVAARRGYKHSEATIEKIRLSNTGKKRSHETRLKMSERNKKMNILPPSRKGCIVTDEVKEKLRLSHLGKSTASWCVRGDKSPLWKGGITPINKMIRSSLEYKKWRTSVFERDNYTCVFCGIRSGNGKTVKLNADHIKPFHSHIELRFDIDNGRTLCVDCHKTTDTYGRSNKKLLIGVLNA